MASKLLVAKQNIGGVLVKVVELNNDYTKSIKEVENGRD